MKAELKYTVKIEDAGKSAEKLLKKEFGASSSLIKYLKLNGRLRINGEICRSVDVLRQGDVLTADVEENEASENIVPTDIPLDIVYEDEYIMAVNKPKNMSVHPSIGNFDRTLANGVMYYWAQKGEYHKFHAVTRLDKDTSGLCIIAKNSFSHNALSVQMKNGKFIKRYKAIVWGRLENSEGTIDSPIKREKEGILKRTVSPDGKRAVTHYRVLKENEKFSLLDISLETGRTHQIRVHFASIYHPLVGDWLYGDGDNERDIAKGQLLQAYYVGFYHPKTKEFMEFSLPPDGDMEM